VTGKPAVLGGSPARRRATGLGVVYIIQALTERWGPPLASRRIAIQGFGNVGATIAAELHRIGASVVAVSDVSGGLVASDGLDVPALVEWVRRHRYLAGFPAAEAVGRADVLEVPCDVLVPAALENQIVADNATRIDCEIVVEAANGPTSPAADEILAARGIQLVPDVLANAGGVTVSYFEWMQGHQRYTWEVAEVERRMRRHMRDGLERVLATTKRLDCGWRTGALSAAIERVAEAARARAIFP
jgi:glutamate dehydrogenase (NAD(P)+)